MNFFISHKDRKGFVKCEMYSRKCMNKEAGRIIMFDVYKPTDSTDFTDNYA